MKYRVFLIVSLTLCFHHVITYRILAVVPTPSYSHQVAFRPIWNKLLSRGHELVLLTTDPMEESHENLTQIDLSSVYPIKNRYATIMNEIKNHPLKFMSAWSKLQEESLRHEFDIDQVRELINSDNKSEKIDLVMTEILFPATYAFSEKFNCPLIGILSMPAPNVFYSWIGSPINPIVSPDIILPFYKVTNLKERLIAVIYHLFMTYYRYDNLRIDQAIVDDYFKNNSLTVYELKERISMMFVNSHPILHGTRPLGDNIINFNGGFSDKKYQRKPLEKDVEDFLNSATNGAIYFSLGGNIKSKDLSPDTVNTILETFQDLPYKILMKYEGAIHNCPDNVKTITWASQINILNHTNTRLFISQGGLISIEESISSHVPLLLLPFFADQMSNSAKLVDKGIGLRLDHQSLSKEHFKNAILSILNNKTFYDNVRRIDELYKDEPISGVDKAVWYAEYVIRHNGAPHLRSPYLNFEFYELYCLDLIVLLIVFVYLLIYISRKVLVRVERVFKAKVE